MHGKRTAAGMPGAAEAAAVFSPTASKPVLHRVDARDDRRGQYAWGMFEFARTPYIGLIFVFVFAHAFPKLIRTCLDSHVEILADFANIRFV